MAAKSPTNQLTGKPTSSLMADDQRLYSFQPNFLYLFLLHHHSIFQKSQQTLDSIIQTLRTCSIKQQGQSSSSSPTSCHPPVTLTSIVETERARARSLPNKRLTNRTDLFSAFSICLVQLARSENC